MSLRANLMLPEEARYQGPVSQKFLGLAFAAVVLSAILVWLGLAFMQRSALEKEVQQFEAEWKQQAPRYELVKAKQAGRALVEALDVELRAWNTTRVEWGPLFDELNSKVPASVQITRLAFRYDWSVLKPAAAVRAVEAGAPSEEGQPPPKVVPGIPARRNSLTLSGRAAGDAGGDDAVKFAKALKDSPGYSAVFETIKLQNILRDSQPNDQADRTFSIDAAGVTRELR